MSRDLHDRVAALAASLARDAADRDRQPVGAEAEMGKLKASGLLRATAPVSWGGAGLPFSHALRVLRTLAAQDNATAMLLGYHWVVLRTAHMQGGLDALCARVVAANEYLAGVTNARDSDLVLTRDGDGYRLEGRRTFCTGARVADELFVAAVSDDRPATLLIPADRDGVRAADDWNAFGERGSESGSVTFRNVRVADHELVVSDAAATPAQSLSAPLIQLLFANLYLGAAEGALRDAVDYVRTKSKPWVSSGVQRAQEDPYVQAGIGTMHADLLGVRSLADAAADAIDEAEALGDQLTARRRGEVAISVYSAKLLASRVGLEVTSRTFEVMGARATGRENGLDRRWRDVRVHTLHDPAAYKAREIGVFVLDDVVPAPSPYS